ncbi:unnamed protein product [Closterium sp. Naga37s-1]|nr:unnamed protein product [Closterium sp. Naga37s-1]
MHTAPDIVVDGIPRRLLAPSPGSTAAKLGLLAPSVAQVLQQSVPTPTSASQAAPNWPFQPTTGAAAQAGNYASWSSACPSPPSQLPVASPTTSSCPVAWAPPSSLVAASQAPPGNGGGAAAVSQTPTLHAPPSAQVFPPAHGSAEWPGSTPATCQPTTRVSLSACSDDGTTGSPQVSHMLPPLLPLSSGCLSQPAREPWPLERNQSVTSKPAIQLSARDACTSGAAAAPAGAQGLPPSASPSSFPEQVSAIPPSHEPTVRVNCGNGPPQSPLHTFLTLAPPSKQSPLALPTNPSSAGAAPTHVPSVGEAQSLADDDSLAVESLLLIRALRERPQRKLETETVCEATQAMTRTKAGGHGRVMGLRHLMPLVLAVALAVLPPSWAAVEAAIVTDPAEVLLPSPCVPAPCVRFPEAPLHLRQAVSCAVAAPFLYLVVYEKSPRVPSTDSCPFHSLCHSLVPSSPPSPAPPLPRRVTCGSAILTPFALPTPPPSSPPCSSLRAGLVGSLSPQVLRLPNLESLVLGQVSFNATALLPIINGLTHLKQLALMSTALNYRASQLALANMTRLQDLTLQRIGLSGRLSDLHLPLMPSLLRIDLSMNSLTGEIPQELASHPFSHIDLSTNALSGAIPPPLIASPALVNLILFGNELEGALPENFTTATSLQHLDLSNNGFTGEIPQIYKECSFVELSPFLNLSSNGLTGYVPGSIGEYSLRNVKHFVLSVLPPPPAISSFNSSTITASFNPFTATSSSHFHLIVSLAPHPVTATSSCQSPLPFLASSLHVYHHLPDSASILTTLPPPHPIPHLPPLPYSSCPTCHPPSPAAPPHTYHSSVASPAFSPSPLPPLPPASLDGNAGFCNHPGYPPCPARSPVIADSTTSGGSSNDSQQQQQQQQQQQKQPSSSLSPAAVAGIATAAVAGVAALVLAALVLVHMRRAEGERRKEEEQGLKGKGDPRDAVSLWLPDSGVGGKKGASGKWTSADSSGKTKVFSEKAKKAAAARLEGSLLFCLDELIAATNGFHPTALLGRGGFGHVYHGVLPALDEGEEGEAVAIKVLHWEEGDAGAGGQGEREYETEVDLLSLVRHRHLVRLVGFCSEGQHRMLVYEYMPRGSLAQHLHGGQEARLPWSARQVQGTWGYVAPEYLAGAAVSEKVDVYAFGVLLLELVTGRSPLGDSKLVTWLLLSSSSSESSLTLRLPSMHWQAEEVVAKGELGALVDPLLFGDYNEGELRCLVHIIFLCLHHHPDDRPAMSHVVQLLEGEAAGQAAGGQITLPHIAVSLPQSTMPHMSPPQI